MAKLPALKSPEGSMTTEASSVKQDPSKAGLGGKMIEAAGDAFSALGQKFDDLRDHSEISKAKAEGINAIDDIHTKAMQDPDVWGAPDKVKEQLDNLKDTLASKITSPDARNKFSEEWDVESARKFVGINTQLRAKQIDVDKATTHAVVESKAREFANATHPEERNTIKQQIIEQVNRSVQLGSMNAGAARKYVVDTFGKMNTEQVEHDLNILRTSDNPKSMYDTMKAELEKGKDGMYPDLTEKQRGEFLNKTEKMYAKADVIKTEVNNNRQNIRADALSTQLSSGTLDPMKLNEARANNHITAEDYKTFYDNLLAKDSETIGSDHVAMHALEENILGTMKSGELTKDRGLDWPATRRAIIQANTEGKISKNDMNKLLEYHLMPQQDMIKKLQDDVNQPKNDTEFLAQQNEKKGAVTRRQSLIESVMNMFKKHTDNKPRETAHLLVDHMNYVKDNKTTDEGFTKAAQDVINQNNKKSNMYIPGLSESGVMMIDAKGNKAKVYPDGHYDEQ